MAKPIAPKYRRKSARPLADLVAPLLDPLCVKRGFGSAALISYWGEIVGADYEHCSQAEGIDWPKRQDGEGRGDRPATLTVRVTPAEALYFQHDVPQILERVNQFLGYQAIGRIRIVQGAIDAPELSKRPSLRPLSAEEEAGLRGDVSEVEDDALQEALLRLGRAIKGQSAHNVGK